MKRLLVLLLVGLFAASCDYKGKPVEYSGICNKENDKEYIEVVGFFKNNGSAMCSKRGNEPMRCPIYFVDTPDQPKPVMANVDLGSGASSVENVDGKGLTIRDEKKQDVANSDKVKITASVMVFDGPQDPNAKYAPCSLTVKKIEKAQ